MGLLRDLYRRFRLACHKPRHWQLRRGTFDRRAFRDVVVHNEYQLPARFDPDDVILDVGAHIGSFAHAALRRGAGLVCCCEPDPDNFRLLCHNLAPYADRVALLRCAVWRSDVRVASLSLHNPRDVANTGALQVTGDPAAPSVDVVAFDDLIEQFTQGGRRIRLVKLDCEGAEWPILLTTQRLDRIDALCGEYHLDDYAEAFHVAGYPKFTPCVLEQYLADQDFQVHIRPNRRSWVTVLGNFFAQSTEGRRRAAELHVRFVNALPVSLVAAFARMRGLDSEKPAFWRMRLQKVAAEFRNRQLAD